MIYHWHFCIIIPSYNQAEFLQEAVASVLQQKGGFAVHVRVVDGGSSDNSVQVLKKFGKKITWVSERDQGQTHAINKGLTYFTELITAEGWNPDQVVIAYLNSDDYYLPRAFETVLKTFRQKRELNWLVGDYKVVAHRQTWFHSLIVLPWKRLMRWCDPRWLLLVLNPIPQPATFWRWSLAKKVGSFNQKLSYVMDYEYWLRMLAAGEKPCYLHQTLAGFRIHLLSKGGSQYQKQFAEQLEVAKRFTHNYMLLFLHRLHNWLTIRLYQVVK